MRLVENFFKTSFFALSVIFLSGCHTPPKIERKYDNLSKQHICSLDYVHLIYEWGRHTELALERYEDEDYVRGLIRVWSDSDVDHFRPHPNIAFDVYKNNYRIKSIKLKSQTIFLVEEAGILLPNRSLSKFQLSYDDFREVAYAEHVKLYVSDKSNSAEGTITKSELEIFKEFDKKCIP